VAAAWRLAASVAIHALLCGAVLLAARREAPPEMAGTPLQVRLLGAAGGAQPGAPGLPARPAARASAPVRAAIRYYAPDELERPLLLLRDRSGDDGVGVTRVVVMQLFVDVAGRVEALSFEGPPLPAAEQRRLRAAFMTLEFLPALRGGQAVPARIRIELLPE
jgi:hypothetical protein